MELSVVGCRVPEAERVVSEALAALKAKEWEAVVATTDAASIRTLQCTYLARQESLERTRLGLDDDDDAFDLIADEFRTPWLDDPPITYHELHGIGSFEEACALTADEFMVRWAKAREDFFGPHLMPTSDTRVVVGSIQLEPDIAFVLMMNAQRAEANPLACSQLVVVLRDAQRRWGIDASTDWLGVGGYLCRV